MFFTKCVAQGAVSSIFWRFTCRCPPFFVKMEEDEEHGILLGMSQDSPLLQMSKFFRTLALSPWNDIVDPPYSDPQGAPIFDDKGRLVGIFAFTLRRMSFSIPIGVVKEYLEMTIPKRVLDKFSPSALQIDGVMVNETENMHIMIYSAICETPQVS